MSDTNPHTPPTTEPTRARHRQDKIDRSVLPKGHIGALLGSFLGDALAAPFAFEPPGTYSTTLPEKTELIGGGALGWAPGEFTDVSQMAIIELESIIANDGVDEADLFNRFSEWVSSNPRSIGDTTRSILTSGLPWDRAAASHYQANPNSSAGNGSIARSIPAALWFAELSDSGTIDVARRLSALTHGDPAAGEGRALVHLMIKRAIDLTNPLQVLPDLIDLIDPHHAPQFRAVLLEPDGHAAISNGTVWGCLAQAIEATRRSKNTFGTIRIAGDFGGQTHAVAALAGGIDGSISGPSSYRDLDKELRGTVGNTTYEQGEVRELIRKMAHTLEVRHARRRPFE